jgi:hypothetical protein
MAVLALPILLILQTPAQQVPKATIEGVVMRVGTNEPVARARISIMKLAGPGAAPIQYNPGAIPPVMTDSQGRFIITDLEPGSYQLTAARNGFARQMYGERSPGRGGAPLNVVGGQSVKDIVFRLTPAGTVIGRVSDTSGEPVAGIQVQLLQSRYDVDGKRTFQTVSAARTNDRGEYRLYWITPGRYFLNAAPGRSSFDFNAFVNEVVDPGFTVTYYPGTLDVSIASAIEVTAGAEIGPLDFTIQQQRVYRVRGRVIDIRTGQSPKSANVSMFARNPTSGGGGIGYIPGSNYNSGNGTFEVRDVAPGEYLIRAFENADGDPFKNSAQLSVSVVASDVENLVLAFGQGMSILARLALDNGSSISSLDRQIRVLLSSSNSVFVNPPAVKPDGTAVIENIVPGDYRLSVLGLPPGVYIKSAVLDQVDVLQSGLSISGPVGAPLDVVISPNSGEIDGVIVNRDNKPVSGIQAVLIPDQRNRRDLYKRESSDQNGHFTMKGVPPAGYRLFAWEDLEPFAYNDPEILRRYEQAGTEVKVSESSKATLEVKMIPAGQ